MTADEYFALGDQLPPNAQLIDGELVVNSPTFRHDRIILWLSHLHLRFAETHPGAGEVGTSTDTRIGDHSVYKPGIWWVPEDRQPPGSSNRFAEPPPLVAEVRSRSTWRFDVGTKLRHYERAGGAEVWLIDTYADAVLVFRRSQPSQADFDVSLELGAGEQLTTPLIPGWTIDLAELFSR